MRRLPIRFLSAAAFTLLALPALAGAPSRSTPAQGIHPEAAAMCRAQCLSTANTRLGGATEQAVQACNIRCAAGMAFLAAQNSSRATAEQTGRGRTAAPVAQPVAMGVPGGRAAATSHAVLYSARLPSAAFGLVVGEADRLRAHNLAERACAAGGSGCRAIGEFTEACAAAAQGIRRSQWALFVTSDPSSYTVTSMSGGSGPTQAQAERVALMECHSRDPQATCRIAASACGGRG